MPFFIFTFQKINLKKLSQKYSVNLLNKKCRKNMYGTFLWFSSRLRKIRTRKSEVLWRRRRGPLVWAEWDKGASTNSDEFSGREGSKKTISGHHVCGDGSGVEVQRTNSVGLTTSVGVDVVLRYKERPLPV